MSKLFKKGGQNYKKFRPTYPDQLYAKIFNYAGVESRKFGVDLGCGTGQATKVLAKHYERVLGVDPSLSQIENAFQAPNIEYRKGMADEIPAETSTADIITIAQTMHWLNQESVYKEVNRVLVPGGSLAIWGYPRCILNNSKSADELFAKYHFETMKPWWDERRWLLDDYYKHVQLENDFIQVEKHIISDYVVDLSLSNFINYMETQSCRLAFLDAQKTGEELKAESDPLKQLASSIEKVVDERNEQNEVMLKVNFPIILILGKKKQN